MAQAEVNGTTIHYQFDGSDDAPVVMLSNSLASNLAIWDHQVPALLEAGYRVLRYDSRGHGRSHAPAGPYSIELLGRDAVGLMDACGLDQVCFCGLSMGGMVGQWLGANAGDRLISLALCDTASHMEGGGDAWQQRIEAVEAGGMEAVVEGTVERWFTKPGMARLPDEVGAVRAMILGTPVVGFQACCMAIRDLDLRPGLGRITTPTLVIVGEEDPGTPVEKAREIHAGIAGSELVILPDCAHLSNLEQAPAFNEALLGFLARHG